jgi:pyrimidine dimer DNA glycosylase
MRIWTLHPKYLDPAGLTALWREALLARKVLLNRTRGYRHHPQLHRFRAQARPIAAINSYLEGIHLEAVERGYRFDPAKIGRARLSARVAETAGQVAFEWSHLKAKLRSRNPAWLRSLEKTRAPDVHPMFRLVPGPRKPWERANAKGAGLRDDAMTSVRNGNRARVRSAA